MLQRVSSSNGVIFYSSPLLAKAGVPHAFSTRLGGVSPAPFDSLNLGNPNGCDIQDDSDHIQINYARLQTAIDCADRERCWVHQVHGGEVVDVPAETPFINGMKADALVTDAPARILAVRVADCVPILLCSQDGAVVAAVHAGWRGVMAGIIPLAVARMRQTSTSSKIVAAVGPCIGFDAFEVGPEVLSEFHKCFGAAAPMQSAPAGKGFVDLRAAVAMQLKSAGVDENCIDGTDRCTYAHAGEFFSHRRDKGITGRMAALISPKG